VSLSVEEVREQFAAADVHPGGWALPVNIRGDEDTYRRGLAVLPRYAVLAHELGSPWCFTPIRPYSDELDYAANLEGHLARLRPVAQILAEHGCRLGLEFVGPKTLRTGHAYSFIHTIAGALDLTGRIGTDNTGLLLDSWHWYTSHATIADLDQLSAHQVVYVHVNDAPAGHKVDEQIDKQRLLPGASGVIDIVGFLRALERMGYDGPVVVEPYNEDVVALAPDDRARAARESLCKVWSLASLSSPA